MHDVSQSAIAKLNADKDLEEQYSGAISFPEPAILGKETKALG
jgi:hypothetical protein